jgi:hypothetical protein
VWRVSIDEPRMHRPSVVALEVDDAISFQGNQRSAQESETPAMEVGRRNGIGYAIVYFT